MVMEIQDRMTVALHMILTPKLIIRMYQLWRFMVIRIVYITNDG